MIPSSPTHRRRTSSISVKAPKPFSNTHRRRSSQYSFDSRRSSGSSTGDQYSPVVKRTSGDVTSPVQSNGLGNLADELEAAWDDQDDSNYQDASQSDGSLHQDPPPPRSPRKYSPEKPRDSGIGISSNASRSSTTASSPTDGSQLRKSLRTSRSSRPSSIEEPHISAIEDLPKSLESCMKDVEILASQATDMGDTIAEHPGEVDPVTKFIVSLKEIPIQQQDMETHTARLTTAHASLAMHLINEVRTLQALTSAFITPLAQLHLDEDEWEELLTSLSDAMQALPQPATLALSRLGGLRKSSKDVSHSFTHLSDTLHMSRQETAEAARKLRSTKDTVTQFRKELQQADEGVAWIERGGWDRRLADRESAVACKDIVSGFEETCNSWRRRLVDGCTLEAVAA